MDDDGINVPNLSSVSGTPTGNLNISGVTYVPNGTGASSAPSFYMVSNKYSVSGDRDNDGAIFEYEYNATGDGLSFVRTIDIDGLDQDGDGGNRGDPEGIAWLGREGANDWFAFVAERVGEIHLFSVSPTTAVVSSTTSIDVQIDGKNVSDYQSNGTVGDNDGLESIAYDPDNNVLYVAKEKGWMDVFTPGTNVGGSCANSLSTCTADNHKDIIYKVEYSGGSWVTDVLLITDGTQNTTTKYLDAVLTDNGISDVSDMFFADGDLLLINDEGSDRSIVRIDVGTNKVTEIMDLAPKLDSGTSQPEGLAFDLSGTRLFITGERGSDGGEFREFRNRAQLTNVTLPVATSNPNVIQGQKLTFTVDAPSGSMVDLTRVSNTGTTTLTATAAASDEASFTVTVNSTERVREMNVTYDVELPHKQAAAAGVLPARDFWPAPSGSPSHGYIDKPSAIMVPGDFNRDKVADLDDITSLIDTVYANANNSLMDLDGDMDVDNLDIQLWIESLFESFLGDANLDGTVDATDLNALGLNWLQSNRNWSGGDFNGDGVTDASDLNAQGLNWLLSSNKH